MIGPIIIIAVQNIYIRVVKINLFKNMGLKIFFDNFLLRELMKSKGLTVKFKICS